MKKREIRAIFDEVGAILNNTHVILNSGRHADAYVRKDRLYPYAAKARRLCEELASRWIGRNIQTVIGPAIGGVMLAHWVADYLEPLESVSSPPTIFRVFTEKEMGKQIIKRDYGDFVRGKRVLVVEDVLTTGKAVRELVQAVRENGGKVVGVGALWNRGGVTAKILGVPRLVSLLQIQFPSWDAAECPLCRDQVPFNLQVGHAKEWLAEQEAKRGK